LYIFFENFACFFIFDELFQNWKTVQVCDILLLPTVFGELPEI